MINNHSGVYCAECDVDIIANSNHMCGSDPIVKNSETTLIPVPGLPTKLCCKSCYSFVGRQHYRCKLWKTKFYKMLNTILGINYG